MPYTLPREIVAAAASPPTFEALAVHVVLTHPRAVFYPCMCGLYRGAAAVAAPLISYDDVENAARTTTRMRR
jgi:hypothetical protein